MNDVIAITDGLIDKASRFCKWLFSGPSRYVAPGVKEAIAVLIDRSRAGEQTSQRQDTRITSVEQQLAETRAEVRELRGFLKGLAWGAAFVLAAMALRGHF